MARSADEGVAQRETGTGAPAGEGRGARRRQATRNRLLDAAFRLMAERGADGVAIKEITDAADVGLGSFYNHFESKEAIHAAVIEREYAAHGDRLDKLVAGVDDIAEVVAVSIRHTLLRAEQEPIWGRFLVREGYSRANLADGLGARFLRDVKRGLTSGRFRTEDPETAFMLGAGGVLSAVAMDLLSASDAISGALPPADAPLAERVAAAVLQVLGLTPREAKSVAERPLPEPLQDAVTE